MAWRGVLGVFHCSFFFSEEMERGLEEGVVDRGGSELYLKTT